MTATPPSEEDHLRYLRTTLGPAFVSWLFGQEPDLKSPRVHEASKWLSEMCRASLQEHASGDMAPPKSFMLHPLTYYNPLIGDTGLNALRAQLGAADDPIPSMDPNDVVAVRTAELARRSFGELLLAASDQDIWAFFPARSPEAAAATEAIRNDPALPFTATAGEFDQVMVHRSTGSAGTLQLSGLAGSLILDAFELAQHANHSIPSLEQLVSCIPEALQNARRLTAGEAVDVVAKASLSGVLLSDGVELTFPWGKIRAAEDQDHPAMLRKTLGQRRTQMQDSNGATQTISDAGDVVVEVRVPLSIELEYDFDAEAFPTSPRLRPTDALGDRLMQIQLALALCSPSSPHVVVPVWRRTKEPMTSGGGYSWRDPSGSASRTPARLTPQECDDWRAWIVSVDAVALKKLGHAPARLLRATMERTDPADSLIDAVIAWESLFGSRSEATLRVTTSLARLLEEDPEERRRLRTEAAKLYALRSTVVHGGDYKPEALPEGAQRAREVGYLALRRLIRDRSDLLSFDSGQRSNVLLTE